MDAEQVAKRIANAVDRDVECFGTRVRKERQLTGEQKWQVTVEWVDGTDTRVVID